MSIQQNLPPPLIHTVVKPLFVEILIAYAYYAFMTPKELFKWQLQMEQV